MSQIKMYNDEIAEALVTAVKTVQEELGLAHVEQGDWTDMPAPDNFDWVMPLVLVAFLETDPPELRMNAMRVEYSFRARIFRRKYRDDDSENPARKVGQMAARIWQVLATDTVQPNNLPGWVKLNGGIIAPGCQFQECHVEGPNLYNEDNATLSQPQFQANCAWIDLTVTANSLPTT